MNDFYGSIVHHDRMADLRREADATRRARRGGRITGTPSPRVPLVRPRRLATGIAAALLAFLLGLANSGLVS